MKGLKKYIEENRRHILEGWNKYIIERISLQIRETMIIEEEKGKINPINQTTFGSEQVSTNL